MTDDTVAELPDWIFRPCHGVLKLLIAAMVAAGVLTLLYLTAPDVTANRIGSMGAAVAVPRR